MSNLIRHSWFLLLASVPTVTFLVLGFFSGPAADDFCYAPHLRAYGYFGALKANYLQWQGRYASSSILFLSGYLDPTVVLHWYWVVPTSLILATVLSIYILLYSFNRFVLESAFRKSQLLVASIVFTSIYLISLDRPSEDIYWFSGAVTYQLANVLFILLLAVLVRLYFAQSPIEKCLLLTTSGLLVLFVVGSNETIIIPTASVLASLLWLSLFKDEKQIRSFRIIWASLFVVAILASLIVILAPGNDLRIQYEEKYWGMHKAHSVWELLQAGISAIIWAATNSLRWLLTESYHWFAVLLGLVMASTLTRRLEAHAEKSLIWLPLVSFVLIVAAALPSFYLGRQPPARATASIYAVFWLSFIPSTVILMKHFSWELHGTGVLMGLKTGLVLSMLLSPRLTAAIQDFKDAVLYRLQLHEREIIVHNATQQGHRDLVVPRLMRVPTTIHFRDLNEDKSHYSNRCYALNLGVNSIVARGDADTTRIVRDFKERLKSQVEALKYWRLSTYRPTSAAEDVETG